MLSYRSQHGWESHISEISYLGCSSFITRFEKDECLTSVLLCFYHQSWCTSPSSQNHCNNWMFWSTLPQFMHFIHRKVKLTTTGWQNTSVALKSWGNHGNFSSRDSNIVETQLPGQAENANLMREKYERLRMQQIHLIWSHRAEVAIRGCKWQSGGARRMAVTAHLVNETECGQGRLLAETPTYPILILSSWRVTKKKALEGSEEKFPRF